MHVSLTVNVFPAAAFILVVLVALNSLPPFVVNKDDYNQITMNDIGLTTISYFQILQRQR